jgi:hypothetical protein
MFISLLEIAKAIMPQIKQTTIDKIPKTKVAVALGNWAAFELELLK